MDPSTRGLAFLLSLGALPLACDESKPDGSATDGATSTTGDTADIAPTSGGSMAGTGEPLEGCEAYVAWALMCDPMQDAAEVLALCENDQKYTEAVQGPKCLMLNEQAIACLVASSCDDEQACKTQVYAAVDCLPDPGPVCQAWGVKYVECFPEPYTAAWAGGQCQLYINSTAYQYGQLYAAKLEDQFACLSGLSCAELKSDEQICPL